MEFVKTQRFDRMGAFAYSEEDDTFAAKNLSDDIPDAVKQERLDKIMAIQERIALELNEELVGTRQRVLIDRIEDGKAYGRTQYDSPEVDPEVIITLPRSAASSTEGSDAAPLSPGEFVEVIITEAYPFELLAELPETSR